MSDAVDYFRAYAARAICKARQMPFGRLKRMQRAVGHIYHLLTKEASFAPNVHRLRDFRAAQDLEKVIDESQIPQPIPAGTAVLRGHAETATPRLH